jgi:hypothetical protein
VQRAAEQVDQAARDRQPQAEAAVRIRRAAALPERLEDEAEGRPG